MLKLYDYYRSSACYRVRIALNLKGLSYKAIPIHLVNNGGEQHSQAYQQINPLQLVPALSEHDKIITQSLAIIEYLDEVYPAPALLPQNSYQRACVRSFACTIASEIHPLNNLRVLNYLKDDLHINEDQKLMWYRHWIHVGLTSLESMLNRWGESGEFCFGNTPSIADIFLVPQINNARRYSCDLSDYPTLVRIDAVCKQHPAFINASPEAVSV